MKNQLYISDLLAAADKIQRFTQFHTFESLSADKIRMGAVQLQFIIIGEAAGKLKKDPEIPQRYSSVPWNKLYKMRNCLVHQYWHDYDELIWGMIEDLPTVISQLKQNE